MANIFDMNAMNAALKELYDGQTVANLVYSDNPLLAMLPKGTDFGAKYKPLPMKISSGAGRSANFANAQANYAGANVNSFLLRRVKDYSVAFLDNETMLASAKDKYAFIEAAKLTIDSAWETCSNSLSQALYRSGTGTIGSIGTINTGVIQLTNPGDIVSFEINQVLQSATADGGAPLGAVGYVTKVNRYLGQLTVSDVAMGGAAGTPASWAAGNVLLVQGDSNAKISGLQAWIPVGGVAAGDSFFGVNRSIDTRLQGLVYNGQNQSLEEGIIDAASLLAREGGKPDVLMLSYSSYSALEKALGSKVQIIDSKYGSIGFRGLALNGANSVIKVYADRNCPAQTGYLLTLNTWKFDSLGDAPRALNFGTGNDDGWMRAATSDSAELRVGWYGQLGCVAPGKNAVIQLSA